MVFKKRSTRYGARKSKGRGKVIYRRRRGAIRSMISKLSTHYFRRLTNTGTLTLTSNTNYQGSIGYVGRGLDFVIDNATLVPDKDLGVMNPIDFTDLYDRYKILKVVVQFKWQLPTNGEDVLPDNYLTNAPILYYFRDYDDDADPTVSDIVERGDIRKVVLNPNRFISVALTPAITIDATAGGTNTIKWKQWIDMASPSVKHYGLKFGLIYPGGKAYGRLSYQATTYFACKNAR